MKKIIAFTLSLILLFSVAAFAVDARSATETARALAGEGSAYLYTEKDGKTFEVHFLNELTGEEFEISVPTEEGKAVKIETENDFGFGSIENTLSEENARQAILNEYPEAEIDTILAVKDNGLFEVHVYFKTADRFGLIELNAENGAVIKRKIILSAPTSGWQTKLDNDYNEDVWTAENAVTDNDWAAPAQNNPPAENKPANDNPPSESRGAQQNENLTFISVSQAKSAVTSRHSGAKITEIELDFDDGKYVYEGEARLNGREYDFKVDATTGNLIKWKLDD